jgi:3-hydroxyethyl bacteriochlorophyllide a dehydrogenase
MGYPLVPGYESVGRVRQAGPQAGHQVGERVFVPGRALLRPGARACSAAPLRAWWCRATNAPTGRPEEPGRPKAVLLALAATAYHAVSGGGKRRPSCARPDRRPRRAGPPAGAPDVVAGLPPPTVWEPTPRADGAPPATRCAAPRRPTRAATTTPSTTSAATCASSTPDHRRLAPGGEIVLAGFYAEPLSFNVRAGLHARSADPRAAAEWQRADLLAVKELAESGRCRWTA